MSSGVRPRDGLGLQPRSRTLLNGGGAVLVASPGIEIALAQMEDGSPAAPQRVMLMPVDQVYATTLWDIETEKIKTYRTTTSREWLENLRSNTIAFWGNNPLPFFKFHGTYSEAFCRR